MKRTITLLLFLIITTGLVISLFGEKEKKSIVVMTGKIKMDGLLNDAAWSKAVWYNIDDKNGTVEEGELRSYRAKFAFLKNKNILYFGYEATDKELIGDQSEDEIWQDDCVELWFNFKKAEYEEDPGYYQVGLAPTTSSKKPGIWIWRTEYDKDVLAKKSIKLAMKKTKKGWAIEAVIDLKGFVGGHPISKNATANVSVVNMDSDGERSHITWNGDTHYDTTYFVPLVIKK